MLIRMICLLVLIFQLYLFLKHRKKFSIFLRLKIKHFSANPIRVFKPVPTAVPPIPKMYKCGKVELILSIENFFKMR